MKLYNIIFICAGIISYGFFIGLEIDTNNKYTELLEFTDQYKREPISELDKKQLILCGSANALLHLLENPEGSLVDDVLKECLKP